ncbi:MAG: ABC transporter ATP-binding protein [bacterium]
MIQLNNLTKTYDGKNVVDHLNLNIKEKEIFALLGPNGAGKTTTIRMLTMLTKISEGSAYINGYKVEKNNIEVKRSIGVVTQQSNMERELTAWENLELHGMLYQMNKEERRERIRELLDYVGLTDKKDDKIATFSGGMVRRMMIARSLMHKPRVLFLDEPTVGLDPQTRRKIWDLIKVMQQEGMTVLLTTHYIEEAESLCGRVGVIDHGQLIALGTPQELQEKTGLLVVEYLKDQVTERMFFADRSSALDYANGLHTDFKVRATNLEDVFVQLTGRGVKS